MNRLTPHGAESGRHAAADSWLTECDGPLAHSRARYAAFVPMHYERNYAYPLIVWLHGHQQDEDDLKQLMPRLSLRNYLAIAPRGTRQAGQCGGRPAYSWGQTEADILMADHRVRECVSAARERYHVHAQRIFLMGAGVGGTMALRLGLAQPDAFAGVISLNGPMPRDHAPLARLQEARELPLTICFSSQNGSYGEDQLCHDLRLLHIAGMSVALQQYHHSDELPADMLRDVNAWIMGQVTQSVPTPRQISYHGTNHWN